MSDSEKVISDAWNQFITPNLDALSRYLEQPEWQFLSQYFRVAEERLNLNLQKSMNSPETTRAEAFLRGEIATMHSFNALYPTIKRQIELAAEHKKTAENRNPVSGY